MIEVILDDDKLNINFDYVVSSIEDLKELMKDIYKPIFGEYVIKLTLKELQDIKYVVQNQGMFGHLKLYVCLSSSVFKKFQLAMPNADLKSKMTLYEYMMEGIGTRGLLIDKDAVRSLYSSIGKTREEVDIALDILSNNFGRYLRITKKELSKYFALNEIVYPRTVLLDYIRLSRFRKSRLHRCLRDIDDDIVLAAMVKNIKALHKEKVKYLSTGLGSDLIRKLNTRNINLLYYILVVAKPYHLNDVVVLLELYERGISVK